jgi:hypothetical protein
MKLSGQLNSLWIIAEIDTTIFGNGEDYLLCDQAGRRFISRENVENITKKFPATHIAHPIEIPLGILCAFFPAENLLQIVE